MFDSTDWSALAFLPSGDAPAYPSRSGATGRSAPRTRLWGALLALAALAACAPPPLRTPVKLDPSAPIGRIEGKKFTGIRIPLEISAVDGWEVSTTYPKFLLEQGYDKEGLEQSQVFLSNPKTQSSMQISFSPAGPNATFSQEGMEWLVSIMTGGMQSELESEYGKGNFKASHGKTQPYKLQGVQYAARNATAYEAKGEKRENGWIYGFSEPFQIFVLYQLTDPDNEEDRKAVESILSTFRYTGAPSPPK